jgi:hypothetical protein
MMAVGGLHQQAMAEVRWRSFWRDDGRAAARALNISRSHLTNLRNGTLQMTDATARRILAAAREEELKLADKIEAEMHQRSIPSREAE